jgi:hypothetical protein
LVYDGVPVDVEQALQLVYGPNTAELPPESPLRPAAIDTRNLSPYESPQP